MGMRQEEGRRREGRGSEVPRPSHARNQMHSDALRCTQMHSDALRCTQMPSRGVIRGHQRPSHARKYLMSGAIKRRHQRSSDALTCQKHVLARLGRVGQVLEVPIPLMRSDHVHVRAETVRDRPEESEGNRRAIKDNEAQSPVRDRPERELVAPRAVTRHAR